MPPEAAGGVEAVVAQQVAVLVGDQVDGVEGVLAIHHDDPEFGYRFITDELAGHGITASRNRVNRLCTQQRIFSNHARKRGRSRTPGPPVHDDLVERAFTATTPNRLWLTDITEHPTTDGKLYLCAVKDACTNRIVGSSVAEPMTSQLAVDALANAVALRRPTDTVVHSDRGASSAPTPSSGPCEPPACRVDGPGRGLRR